MSLPGRLGRARRRVRRLTDLLAPLLLEFSPGEIRDALGKLPKGNRTADPDFLREIAARDFDAFLLSLPRRSQGSLTKAKAAQKPENVRENIDRRLRKNLTEQKRDLGVVKLAVLEWDSLPPAKKSEVVEMTARWLQSIGDEREQAFRLRAAQLLGDIASGGLGAILSSACLQATVEKALN